MPTKFSLLKKTSLTLCLCLLILGCGTTEYEEQANQTLNLVAEADEADKLLGFPVEVPEPKDANGTVLTKHTFLRLPRENYSRHYPDVIRGHAMVLVKYGKQKGALRFHGMFFWLIRMRRRGCFCGGCARALRSQDSKEDG